jgi:ankyrin repeat protein
VVGNRTPLHWCCDRGWLATAQLLITNGALVNATTKVRQSHHNNSYAISLSLQYFSAKSLITKSFLVAAFAIVFLGTKESKS